MPNGEQVQILPLSLKTVPNNGGGMARKKCKVSDMLGMTMASVTSDGSEVVFVTADGRRYKLYHEQDCCERVVVDDIDGDLDILVGAPLVQSEEVEAEPPNVKREYVPDSETWTFYKFATIKGHVTIRFHGSSNGYYSESVSFTEQAKP